jgi:hypothetical protein
MLLATINREKHLLYLVFIGQVRVKELEEGRTEVARLTAELQGGFRLLTDLSHLDSMEAGCESQISLMMELFAENGISDVVRVVPDPKKDIGFNILAAFHYPRPVKIVASQSLEEAARFLSP